MICPHVVASPFDHHGGTGGPRLATMPELEGTKDSSFAHCQSVEKSCGVCLMGLRYTNRTHRGGQEGATGAHHWGEWLETSLTNRKNERNLT